MGTWPRGHGTGGGRRGRGGADGGRAGVPGLRGAPAALGVPPSPGAARAGRPGAGTAPPGPLSRVRPDGRVAAGGGPAPARGQRCGDRRRAPGGRWGHRAPAYRRPVGPARRDGPGLAAARPGAGGHDSGPLHPPRRPAGRGPAGGAAAAHAAGRCAGGDRGGRPGGGRALGADAGVGVRRRGHGRLPAGPHECTLSGTRERGARCGRHVSRRDRTWGPTTLATTAGSSAIR